MTVDTGRNLTLTSEQDSDRYDSKQQSASAGGSFTFGSMTGSASVNLSPDAAGANPGLDKIFDREKEQRRMETAQQLAEIGSQVADIAHTHGRIAAIKAAIKDMKHISPKQKQKQKRKQKHGAEVEWRKANPGKEPTEADITGQVYQTLYNWAMVDSKMGIDGPV